MSGSRKYQERITVQTRTMARTTTGRPTETWSDAFNRRAAIEHGPASEGVKNDQHQNDQQFKVSFPVDPQAAALDPQSTRFVWHSSTGDVVLNVTGKLSGPGRRPELIFETMTDSS
jgi:head-tail adaptor